MQNLKSLIFAILYELQPARISDIFFWCKNIYVIAFQFKKVLNEIASCLIKDVIPYIRSRMTLSFMWYSIVWFSGFYVMNYFEFGSLWIILSLFALIIFNLGEKDDDDDTWSAYSVFNKGYRNILGALTADQFDKEIRHRRGDDNNTENANNEDGNDEAVIDKRHMRRGKKGRRGYEDKLIRRHQQQQAELTRMIEDNDGHVIE